MLYKNKLKERYGPRWWDDNIVIPWRVFCKIRVLMVTDGATFDSGNGYRLSRVLEALQHDLPSYIKMEVTTARHAAADATADINNLRFNSHDLSQYDQIWIFAVRTGNAALDPGEVTALWEFMQGGGGVFATGDHDNLGEALCARIPRIRSMRRWFAPNPGPNGEPPAPTRNVNPIQGENDTSTGPDEEGDGIPQIIAPTMQSAPGRFVFFQRQYPHPVLCGGDGVITKLPPHMHEGLVEVPQDLEMPIEVDGTAVEEYPRRGGVRLPPEVIADSTINNNPGASTFGLIGAYDGHQVNEISGGVGRIVVDSTWHHFWNLNVNQFASAHQAVADAIGAGVAPDPADLEPADAWEQIRDYFQNIALWLARSSTQRCIRRRGLWTLTQHVDVQMALNSSAQDRIVHIIDVGTKARDALKQIAPQCEVMRFVWETSPRFEDYIPWRIPLPEWIREQPQAPLINPELLENLVLGAQIEQVSRMVEGMDNPDDVSKLLDDVSFDEVATDVTTEAINMLSKRLQSDAERIVRFAQ